MPVVDGGVMLREQGQRDGYDVPADGTCIDVPAQILAPLTDRTVSAERVEHLLLSRAFHQLALSLVARAQQRLPMPVPRTPASLRRALNSRSLMLVGLRPSTSPISRCDDPCAYASHSISRSRGLSWASARCRSVRRAD